MLNAYAQSATFAGGFDCMNLCVLLIDDCPDDRSLVHHELRREIPGIQIDQISSLPELEARLATSGVDLVITDYQLRGANGLEVLRKVKAACPETPVIMFTGSGSEEVAVEAMKAGLDDYLLKSVRQQGRLAASVKLALKMRQNRRELREAETRCQMLFDTVPVGLFRCTPAGLILDANPALASMLGFPDRNALLNARFPDLHAGPDEFARWRETLERQGSVGFIETRFHSAAGEVKWVQIHAKALRDPESERVFYEGSVEDITERKQAEAERERLIAQLQDALAKVKTLTGLLPICASCKKIREDDGHWDQIELYIQNHSDAQFTHSFCPDCVRRLYPEVFVDTAD